MIFFNVMKTVTLQLENIELILENDRQVLFR